ATRRALSNHTKKSAKKNFAPIFDLPAAYMLCYVIMVDVQLWLAMSDKFIPHYLRDTDDTSTARDIYQ
ncbi:unnamed protein product, partial [Rotaria sp. Silwood1]